MLDINEIIEEYKIQIRRGFSLKFHNQIRLDNRLDLTQKDYVYAKLIL